MSEIKTINMPDPHKRPRLVSIGSQSSAQASGVAKGKGGKGQRKSSSLPTETVEYLKAWMMSPEHIAHPYPTEQEKAQIMADTGIELKQLTNWFVNNRKRYWKPRVEARLQQQAHAAAAAAQAHAAAAAVAAAAAAVTRTNPVTHHPNAVAYANPVTQTGPVTHASVVAHTNPVTPDVAFRPTVNVQPNNSFVSFDLCSPQQSAPKPPTLPMVSTDFPRYVSPQTSVDVHTISEASSSSSSISTSENDSISSAPEEECNNDNNGEEYDATTGIITRTEMVDVHIVRPLSGQVPTIEDVTVLPNVPSERIIRSYESCPLTIRYPRADRRKMQSRRDAEIVRVKKNYLKLYFEQAEEAQPSPPSTPAPKRKREEQAVPTPRSKFHRKSLETWKDACQAASNLYDESLPSLDEAVQLFGY